MAHKISFPSCACQKEGDNNCKFILSKRQVTLPLGLQCQLSSPAGCRQEQSEDVLSRTCPPSTQLCIEREVWDLEGIWTSPEVAKGIGCVTKGSSALNKSLLKETWIQWTLGLCMEGSKRIAKGQLECAKRC